MKEEPLFVAPMVADLWHWMDDVAVAILRAAIRQNLYTHLLVVPTQSDPTQQNRLQLTFHASDYRRRVLTQGEVNLPLGRYAISGTDIFVTVLVLMHFRIIFVLSSSGSSETNRPFNKKANFSVWNGLNFSPIGTASQYTIPKYLVSPRWETRISHFPALSCCTCRKSVVWFNTCGYSTAVNDADIRF